MQAESLSAEDGTYCVAAVMAYNPQTHEQLKTGRPARRGAKSIEDWLAQQVGGSLIGTRDYVDNEGVQWLIAGYSVAKDMAKGHEKKYRKKAGELAAYALGGNLKYESKFMSKKTETKSGNINADEISFENAYFGEDGAICLQDDDMAIEERIFVQPAYTNVRGRIFKEYDGVSLVDETPTRVFVVAAPIPLEGK